MGVFIEFWVVVVGYELVVEQCACLQGYLSQFSVSCHFSREQRNPWTVNPIGLVHDCLNIRHLFEIIGVDGLTGREQPIDFLLHFFFFFRVPTHIQEKPFNVRRCRACCSDVEQQKLRNDVVASDETSLLP